MIAGVTVRIDSIHDRIHNLCANYLTSEEPELIIHIDQTDIEHTKEKAKNSLERLEKDEVWFPG